MRKRRKKLGTIMMILMVGTILQTTKVEAALQSNGGTPLQANLNDWVYYTRQMQATGGTLGLTDTINDDLTSNNKNLDIHMQKNTEYGAMTILSASAYGNPNKIEDGGTTTGNASGIQINLNTEWVAAGPSNTMVGKMKGAVGRYWNNYGTGNGSNSKNGDAMAETSGWHGSTDNSWLRHRCGDARRYGFEGVGVDAGFARALNDSIFSYNGLAYYRVDRDGVSGGDWCSKCDLHNSSGWVVNVYERVPGNNGKGYANLTHSGRAVVVVGSGV